MCWSGYVLLAPAIVAGVMTLGVMQQILRAFGRVEGSLQYLFKAWPTIIELASVYRRLREFEKQIKIKQIEALENIIYLYKMIFLLFIFIPIIEISIFITVGSNIGILNTIAIILLTAIVGIFFVRRQGLNLLFNAQRNMSQGIMPTEEIKGGIFLLISGLLLITPGFFTDCIGFSNVFKTSTRFYI